MKTKLNSLFQLLLLLSFLSILVIDHFEQIKIPLSVPLIVIIICIVANAMTADIAKQIEHRTKFIRNIGFTVIFMITLFVLDFLGGVSQSGIGFYSPLVWVLVVLSVVFSTITYKKTVKTKEQ